MNQTNSDVNTKSRMCRTFSGSDSDPSCSGDSSDDSHRGSKRHTKPQYSYDNSKRARLDNHPMTTHLDDQTMDNADSLFSSQDSLFGSQQSFKDEIYSSQPVSVGNGVSEFYNQPTSGTTYMSSLQTLTRADAEETNRQINAKRKQSKQTKGITKGQEELSSQKSNNHLEKDDQRAKNRQYARDSRERKNNKLSSLEHANNHQRSIIQIYTKAMTVFYKRLHGGAEPKWAKYDIPWFNSRDGECEKCQRVACLLPVEDNSFFEELGNNTFGTIIASHSDVGKISICEIMPTQRDNPNSTHLLKMSPGANFPPPLQRRSSYSQILPAKLDSTGNCVDRQTQSEKSLSFLRLLSAIKSELHDKDSRGGFNILNEASSQIPNLFHKASIVRDPQQTITDVNNPSSSTKFAGNAHIFAATHPSNTNGTFNGERDIRAAQTPYKPCPIVAPVNMSLDVESFSNQNFVASNGNNLTTRQTDFIGYDPQPQHGLAFMRQPEKSTTSSLSQSAVFAPMNEAEDSRGISSMENLHQDIIDVEDLQSSLETA